MILALETGSAIASVALLEGESLAAERAFRHRMNLSRELMPETDALLAQAGVDWESVEAVAVGLGPGSYTGLRIGVVTAKTLAWASGRPVLGVSSLAALAAPHLAPADTLICAVMEARAGEFFTALYQYRGEQLLIRAEPTVLTAPELAERLTAYPGPVVLAGHSARCARALEDSSEAGSKSIVAFRQFDEEPQARWVGRLAAIRCRAGERDDPVALTPHYVRAPAPRLREAASSQP